MKYFLNIILLNLIEILIISPSDCTVGTYAVVGTFSVCFMEHLKRPKKTLYKRKHNENSDVSKEKH